MLESALSIAGDLAAVLTAVVAVVFSGHRACSARGRRKRLELYLQESVEGRFGHRRHSLVHLAAALGMTESEVMQAAFASGVVRRSVREDRDTGLATEILLAYEPKP